MAGLKPEEVWRSTMVEVLRFINAYDRGVMQFFNLNTRILAWYSIAPFVDQSKMPSFNSFLNNKDEGNINAIGEDLNARAAYMRKKLREAGYLKEKN